MVTLPSLREIETFVTVAEVKSFTMAAERMHVSTSAISHRIHELEKRVGVSLLDRSSRMVRLTPEGRRYLRELQAGLKMLRGATEAIHPLPDHEKLVIAAVPIYSFTWLIPRLAGFMAEHPELRVEVLTWAKKKVPQADIYIGVENFDDDPDAVVISPIDVLPVCSVAYAREHKILAPQDLARVTLIEVLAHGREWDNWLQLVGIDPATITRRVIVESQTQAFEMVRAGVGVAFGVKEIAANQSGITAPFEQALQYPYVLVASSPGRWQRAPAQAFRQWLMQEHALTKGNRARARTAAASVCAVGGERSHAAP